MTLNPIRENMTELQLKDGIIILFSYKTPVAMSDKAGVCVRTEQHYSRTTSKHITQWLEGRPARKEPQAFFNALLGD